MSAYGFGCVKTPAMTDHVETSSQKPVSQESTIGHFIWKNENVR